MKSRKKILSILLKSTLGLGCLFIIYFKLRSEFNSSTLLLLQDSILSVKGFVFFTICVFLIPVNWGIESYKWQLITEPVERIDFKTAATSVYSGVCLGNFAPGRATEFLGKILYFSDENKSKVTVLHFINGMIQLSVTLIVGLIALVLELHNFSSEYSWLSKTILVISSMLLIFFICSIIYVNSLIRFVVRIISKKQALETFTYPFPSALAFRLFIFSILRYLVFAFQFFLLLFLFKGPATALSLLPGIALYFLITSTLPMISFLEAAIRAAIALVVFKESNLSAAALALCSVLLWLINIIVPSFIGYLALLKMQFDFKFFIRKK